VHALWRGRVAPRQWRRGATALVVDRSWPRHPAGAAGDSARASERAHHAGGDDQEEEKEAHARGGGAAGRMIDTRMLNLGRGTTGKHGPAKSEGLYRMLKNDKFPDLVALTEVWGRPGQKREIDAFFQPLKNEYDVFYSLRSRTLPKRVKTNQAKPNAASTAVVAGGGVDADGADGSGSGNTGNGGGVALLVHKRLCVNVRQRPFETLGDDGDDARSWLDGHLRCFQLEPDVDKARRRASARVGAARSWRKVDMPLVPLIVTVGYAPPASTPWGNKTREIIFKTLIEMHAELYELRQRQQVQVFALVHTNAPDGGVDLTAPMLGESARTHAELKYEMSLAPRRADSHQHLEAPAARRRRQRAQRAVGAWRAKWLLADDGTRRLQRAFTDEQRATGTAQGKELAEGMAAAGMLPVAGLMGHCQNDSWTPSAAYGSSLCPKCADGQEHACLVRSKSKAKRPDKRNCKQRLRMHSQHDQIWIDEQLAWRAHMSSTGGTELLQVHVRRILWSTSGYIDHAVLSMRVFVPRQQRVRDDADPSNSAAPSTASSDTDSDVAGDAPRMRKNSANLNSRPDASLPRRRQPRSFRPPLDLLAKHIEISEMAKMQNGLAASGAGYAVLRVFDDGDDATAHQIDDVAQALSDIVLESQRVAMQRRSKQRVLPADAHTLRGAKHDERVTSVALRRALTSYHAHKTPEGREAVRLAADAKRLARKVLHERESLLHSTEQTYTFARAPREFWRQQAVTATDPGAPKDVAVPLLVEQHDARGGLISTDRGKCEANIVANRRRMYDVPDAATLGAAATEIMVDAAACMHVVNSRLQDEHARLKERDDSAVSRSVSEPIAELQSLAPVDQLGALRARLHTRITAYRAVRCAASVRGQEVQEKYPLSHEKLNRDIERLEVLARCNELDDVSPGTDGVAPVSLRLQDDGKMIELIWRLFLVCQATGTLPTQWDEHRNVLLYKGKGTDPFHIGNYRGLGIDKTLCKLWSLVWAERIEVFLRETNGLSSLQGGFQRQRGPPEQAFTLAETVRSTIRKGKGVHLVFLDVKEAYDSVLHSVLWQRCVDKGIGGTCLAALQAIYRSASAAIDVAGDLLGPVPIRRGVLQGNPLSPALFNIYLDGAIRRLEELGCQRVAQACRPLGIYLPRVSPDALGGYAPLAPDPGELLRQQADMLPCLFFADDGLLLDSDIDVVQLMLNEMVQWLAEVGLRVHPTKTKWMYVPPANDTKQQYEAAATEFRTRPLLVNGQPVKLVETFDYLGVKMSWRWNYATAWREAQSRARKAYWGARRGGWQHRGGSMAAQLAYAQAKIFCHFNHVAAIAGAGGCASSAPWRKNETVVAWTLRTIAHLAGGKDVATALAIEAGVWDQETRIDMLLLRMWCKFLTMPREATFVRAMCLSVSSMEADQLADPLGKFSSIDQLHKQTWGQQWLAAVERLNLRFGVGALGMRHELVATQVTLDYTGDGERDTWLPALDVNGTSTAAALAFDSADTRHRCRLIATPHQWAVDGALTGRRTEGESCWQLPCGTGLETALAQWTPQLKEATYAALRTRGNECRQVKVRAFLASQREQKADEQGHQLRTWAASIGFSYLQPYWHLANVRTARRLARMRFDMCPTEDSVRRKPTTMVGSDGITREHPRLDNPGDRSCYNCHNRVRSDVPNVFWNETQEHVLCDCTEPHLVLLRDRFRAEATALFGEARSVALARAAGCSAVAPDLTNVTALLTVMRLCISVGAAPITTAVPVSARPARAASHVPPHHAEAAARRICDAPRHVHDHRAAANAAAWSSALTADWCNVVRDPRRAESIEATPGYRLAALAANHAQRVFDTRASLLGAAATRDTYQRRLRDPSRQVAAMVRPRVAVRVDGGAGDALQAISDDENPP
jgi:hypothetical protein